MDPLNLIQMGMVALWFTYNESIYRYHNIKTMLPKPPDFVPFSIFQVYETQFWCLFFKQDWQNNVEKAAQTKQKLRYKRLGVKNWNLKDEGIKSQDIKS